VTNELTLITWEEIRCWPMVRSFQRWSKILAATNF